MKLKIDQLYGLIDEILIQEDEKSLETLIFDKLGDNSLRVTLLNGKIFDISEKGEVKIAA